MTLKKAPILDKKALTRALKPHKKKPSPLEKINLRVFLIPLILMIIGGIIWGAIVFLSPTNITLLLLGQIIFMIGMFVAIILGFWVMTLIRITRH